MRDWLCDRCGRIALEPHVRGDLLCTSCAGSVPFSLAAIVHRDVERTLRRYDAPPRDALAAARGYRSGLTWGFLYGAATSAVAAWLAWAAATGGRG